MENKIKLEMDINTLNLIMGGLGRLPYEQVFQAIEDIRQQVGPQLQAQQQGQPEASLDDSVIQ
jgi:hypothetical protein